MGFRSGEFAGQSSTPTPLLVCLIFKAHQKNIEMLNCYFIKKIVKTLFEHVVAYMSVDNMLLIFWV